MKYGIRTPSPKKAFKARTTGKVKRAVKKATVPGYGKKGTGVVKDPKKAVYNKVYGKTTTSVTSPSQSASCCGCGGCLTGLMVTIMIITVLFIIIW